MKAIILTYSPVDDKSKELLKKTQIFKLAINQHGEEYNPDMRICSDWNLQYLLKNFNQKIISMRERLRCQSQRVQYTNIEFKGATIIGAVEWLISKGYKDILIVGDNTVNTKTFQDNVNRHMFTILFKPNVRIFQYHNGNFFLPILSVEDFIEGDFDD